jgi:hypothetical protein
MATTKTAFELVTGDVSRKLRAAANAMRKAREMLREIEESSFYSRQEKDSAEAFAAQIYDAAGRCDRTAAIDRSETVRYWTVRDAEESARQLQG